MLTLTAGFLEILEDRERNASTGEAGVVYFMMLLILNFYLRSCFPTCMKNALITWMSEKKGEKKKEEGSVGRLVLWLSGCGVVVDDEVCVIVR